MQLGSGQFPPVGPLLEPGEPIVWQGAPGSMYFLSHRQIAAIATSLISAAVFYWIATVFWALQPGAIMVAVLIFVGSGIAWSFWILGRWLLRRIGEHYALTDRRVLIIGRDGRLRAEFSLLSAHLIRLVPAPGLRGTIILGSDKPLMRFSGRVSVDTNPRSDAPRLSAIEGADMLLDLIMRTAATREREWSDGSG